MPASLPYLASNRNVAALFNKIASAKIPPKFTHDFLKTTIGLSSTNDRQLIPLMRNLGLLDQSNTPTPPYALLKGDKAKAAIADGIRIAYAPLFNADEKANKLSGDKLKSLVAQVAGSDDDMTSRISATFSALVNQGDFEGESVTKVVENEKAQEDADAEDEAQGNGGRRAAPKGLRTEFQYVIQVQLPSNGTEETYLNIFNAIRKTFV
ncbi:DUF5343 domain-containing protein [Bradyrhizobium sp. 4]|uniref:DUF5343 domain-containing protein n=1 Tax=unclassified Bradyrhizobium TaxID=2631580 RepID=UPI001FF8EF12|nr:MULTISPECIES: DUF5343 domain-containing protein [unclassified Bradyrhizobium]MCK1403590.1 DUF5343 domain-containing protein [Bradyrhizobium sp. 39]MCK1746785.1 DUF5343 domain-containing protein [Bradyrhizobium sp. 135]UPJ35714.1 DUF5343 domain-containing protein [Bradyrhizobium sp. 4]